MLIDHFNHSHAPFILDDKAVSELLPKLDVQSLMKELFIAIANQKAVQPNQTLTPFPGDKGDYITYLGALADEGVFGAKLSPYIVTETTPIITAWTNLMSMKTGQPLLWCDSGQLTVERTAGTTALAIDCLAPQQSQQLAMVGAGNVALAHLRHVLDLRNWKTIHVFAPELSDDLERQAIVSAMDPRIEISTSVMDATNQADVIMLCTSSAAPVIAKAHVKASALITSISTNAVNAHEIPPEMLNDIDVYCDYKETTPSSAGEMCLAVKLHDWDTNNIVGDLADLVSGKCDMPDYKRPVFFRSIGLGLEDVAITYGIWQQALKGE
ncbi:ornithine cyclodeaminase family protein [Photobacterium profundum]|uniref:ornithine cyclodeaminase family protein n=1 Tax=Photobacterium profundum TaxID=74109 RepID=UPI003D11CF78